MRSAFWVVIGAFILTPLPAHGQKEPLALVRYLDWRVVENPAISPDGRTVVYTCQTVDKVNDKWVSSLRIANINGTDDHFFAEGSSPKWSPDGRTVAFLSATDKGATQIFVRERDAEHKAVRLTNLDRPPSNLSWSPDGRMIAFTKFVEARRNTWNIDLPGRPEGAKWTDDPRILTRLVYRIDRLQYVDDGFFQIFVVAVDGGSPAQLTSDPYDHGGGAGFGGGLSWTPNGKEIVFSSFHTEDWEYIWRRSDIYAVDVSTKAIRQLTNRVGPDQEPVVSPDGQWVAYTGSDDSNDSYTVPKVYAMKIDGSGSRVLTGSLDRSPYPSPYGSPDLHLFWAPDSSGVYFNVDDRGTRNIYFSSLDGAVKQITHGTHVLTITDVNRGGRAVGTLTSAHQSADIVRLDLPQPTLSKVTDTTQELLGGTKLGSVEEFWYTSVDNVSVQGWIIKPPDFSSKLKYPLVLNIHGGPHAMFDVGFNFALQEFAAKGFVAVYINPRGSTGYGHTFGDAIKFAYPGKDFDDLMRGVDEVIAKGYVDSRNLFVYGCSGGGVLTAWIVGHSNRFAAASANCAVTDWLSFVGTTDAVEFYDDFRKRPWEDASEFLQRSPLVYAGKVTTPTLLMTGEQDLDTPIGQAEEFYRALKLLHVPTALIRLNDEFHGTTSKPSNFLRTQLYLQYWFKTYMRSANNLGQLDHVGIRSKR